jgi:hypothetical protein
MSEKKQQAETLEEQKKRQAYGLQYHQFPVQKLKETFRIQDGEISYLDKFPKKICNLWLERWNDDEVFPRKQENTVCNFEMSLTDSPDTSTWSYKIQLEVCAGWMDRLMKIQKFDDFVKFMNAQHSQEPHGLNDFVLTHAKRDQKLAETWITWSKIFKPRVGLILKEKVQYPPVYESEYYRERGMEYQRRI